MIRPLDPLADRAAVAALFARATDYVTLERGPTPPADSARDLFEGEVPAGVDRSRTLRLGLMGVAGLDGVAEVVLGHPRPDDAYLGLLLLAPEARGRGAGRAMLARVEAEARDRGAQRLLVAVLDANPRGRAFWDREGFAVESRFTGLAFGARRHDVTRMTRAIPGNAPPAVRV